MRILLSRVVEGCALRSPATVLYRNGANSHKVMTFEDERNNTSIAFSIFLSILRKHFYFYIATQGGINVIELKEVVKEYRTKINKYLL